jgi:hypothetical protein
MLPIAGEVVYLSNSQMTKVDLNVQENRRDDSLAQSGGWNGTPAGIRKQVEHI